MARRSRDAGGPPDRPRAPRFAYESTIYDQGALALYALRQEVGPATFRAIETTWLDRYADGSASTDDFIALASEVAGRDLSGFLEDWLRSDTLPPMPGHPDWVAAPRHRRGQRERRAGQVMRSAGRLGARRVPRRRSTAARSGATERYPAGPRNGSQPDATWARAGGRRVAASKDRDRLSERLRVTPGSSVTWGSSIRPRPSAGSVRMRRRSSSSTRTS